MKLEIIIPESAILEKEIEYITLPGSEGELCVYPGHIPLIAHLKSGILFYKSEDSEQKIAVHGGYAEIGSDGVVVLADLCELSDKVDKNRARIAEEKARVKLQEKLDHTELDKFTGKLYRSLTRQNI